MRECGIAHAFRDWILGDVPPGLASPELWLAQGIAVQVFDDAVELTLPNRGLHEIFQHLSFVRDYSLLVPCIGPLPLFAKQYTKNT